MVNSRPDHYLRLRQSTTKGKIMYWDGYTVFSVISGLLLIVLALTPGSSWRERLLFLGSGGGMVWYGWYVAGQTSGTYYFSIWIFIVPVAVIAWGVLSVFSLFYARSQAAESPETVDEEVRP
jgi:hypothetical protein